MNKVIHVIGKRNSGESLSIRLFLKDRGIYLPTGPRAKDFKIITPIDKKNTKHKVGVASA